MKTFFRYFLFLHYALVVIQQVPAPMITSAILLGMITEWVRETKSGEKQAPVQTLLSNSGIQQAQIT